MNYKNKILIKNTIAQYIKIIISVFGALITTRIVLQQLGVGDYGIFSVIAGFIALFGILNASMTVAVQRFLSYEIPTGNYERINNIYSTSILIHIAIAIIIALICETIGLYFVKNKMVFEAGKVDDAVFVFHCVVVSFVFNIISIPQQSALIAYERIFLSSIIGIIETVLKLVAAVGLMFCGSEKLRIYAIMFVAISLIVRLLYSFMVSRSINMLKFKFHFNAAISKELTQFASWNLLGGIANIGKIQGVNVLLNLFFGTVVNAAYGIANQINAQLLFFSSSIFQSSNSQVIQSYRQGDSDRMQFLVFQSSKFAFMMYFSVALIIFASVDDLLTLWLGSVPLHSDTFIRLMIINSCIELFSTPLMFVMQATGRIRNYFIAVSCVMLLILPISYLFLRLGYDPNVVLFVTIAVNLVLLLIRGWFVKVNCDFVNVKLYLTAVVFASFAIAAVSSVLLSLLVPLLIQLWARLLVAILAAPIMVSALSYAFLLNKNERTYINKHALLLFNKISHR